MPITLSGWYEGESGFVEFDERGDSIDDIALSLLVKTNRDCEGVDLAATDADGNDVSIELYDALIELTAHERLRGKRILKY